MIKIKFHLLLILGFLFTFLDSEAQVKSFNTDPVVFIEEYKNFIKGTNNDNLLRELKTFTSAWEQGKFSPVQKESIIKISNNMVGEKLPPSPYFEHFMGSIAAFSRNKLPSRNLDQWQSISSVLIAKNKRSYLSFLEISNDLFSDGIIYSTRTEKWAVDKLDFDFEFDGNEFHVVFKEVNLKLTGTMDSIVIHNTSGSFYPNKDLWSGTKGSIDFDRVIKSDKAFVEFDNYRLKLSNTTLTIDTVKLFREKYFSKPIMGRFRDKLSLSNDSNSVVNGVYPQFYSFKNTLEIKGLVGDNATFEGGYAMKGREIITKTADNSPTTIHIYYKGKKKVTIKSDEFKINEGGAKSPSASLVIHTDSGEITHPGLAVNYQYDKKLFIASRNDEGLQRRPFQDEFHKMEIYVDQILWETETPFMKFDNTNNDQAAIFASQSFYKEILYARIKGALNLHPLEALNAYYSRKLKRESLTFHLDGYADFIGSRTTYLRTPMIELHDLGYLIYDPKTDSVTLNIKLFAAVQSHNKVRDYDVIRLSSTIASEPNGKLNLLNNEMTIQGVQKFYFSDSQSVMAFPTDQIVKVRRDRTIDFGGMVAAGRFDFFGKKFTFNYQKFTMDYTRIDSMRMYFPEENGKGDIAIKSVLRNIYGTLLIDKPFNKSGLKDYPEYPIFRSLKGSEILYDKPNIHGGAYTADNFKFEVDPFEIDSLDNFSLAGLQFDGTFISADIFPEFRHKASIQKDYSLGFVKHTPPGGYPMYGGKGRGNMTMSLSEEGFFGENGTIEYESGVTEFEKILLLPNKTIGQAKTFAIAENGKYPDVNADKPTIEWTPYENEFKISQGSSPIKVFKQQYDFEGTLTQNPSHLSGNGVLSWDLAKLSSSQLDLTANKATSKVASLKIFTADTTKIAFQSNNINGVMDFDKRTGKFGNNNKDAETLFPFNTFATNLNDYYWDMDKKKITAKVGPSMAGTKPMFRSTNPTQDSLAFEGQRGIYDLNDYTLTVEEIPYIDVADSRLYLKEGGVAKIRENGSIDPFKEAKLIANRKDKFHEIYDLGIKVYGKWKVRGTGKYVYTTGNGLKQEFLLDSVVVADKAYISGVGNLSENDSFTLDLKIGYKGIANVKSTQQNLEFTGFVKPLHSFNSIIPSNWIKFNNTVDPNNVIIDVSDPRDLRDKRQYVGLFIANDSSHVYPLFFSWKRRYSDQDVSNDTGIFYYDKKTSSFYAGNKDKLLNGGIKGNFIQLNEDDKSIHAEGLLDFGLESKIIKFKSAGTADRLAGDSAFNFNMAMMLDFPLPKDYTARLKELLLGESKGDISPNNDFFKDAIGEMVEDDKNAKKIIDNIVFKGEVADKDESAYKMILNNAQFRWDSRLRGMYCNDAIELINFDGTPIHKSVDANMLVEHKRSGENIYLYMEFGDNQYFYINIQKNFAYVLSSDPKLNEIFTKSYDKIGTDEYFLRRATERQIVRFKGKLGVD